MRKAIDLALAAQPDLIVVTGDFACGSHGMAEFQRQLRRLAAPLGVVGVLGNHDHGDSKAPFVQPTDPAIVEACGDPLLEQRRPSSVDARRGLLQVAGVDDSEGGHDDLAAVLQRLDRRPGVLRLLLTHHADVALQAPRPATSTWPLPATRTAARSACRCPAAAFC